MSHCRRALAVAVVLLSISVAPSLSIATDALPEYKVVRLPNGIRLHYAEQGEGRPLIFVHGSLSDYTYWDEQIAPFAKHYHVIAYSRRYNFPNRNPPQRNYSAVTDADDLAALIDSLQLHRVFIVGHSYGALTALFLTVRHPELVRAVVLAEPPAVSLLQHLSGDHAIAGNAAFEDIQKRMVAPMNKDFANGDVDQGVGDFIDYVLAKPGAWRSMSATDRAETLRDAREWMVMMTTGVLFPDIAPAALKADRVPFLLMSGGKSYPFLGLIDEELTRLLPDNRRIVFPDSGHQMWLKHPAECRNDAELFFAKHAGPTDLQ